MNIMECNKLSIGYEGYTILSQLSFVVEKGDYLCVIGDNGTGKSTLIRILLGLKKPFGGNIELQGIKRNSIGYLAQQTDVQLEFPASVREVVLSGRINQKGLHPFYTSTDKKMAEDALKTLDISELKNKCYRELSGGQQQRVLLARAICAAGDVLILDEPTTGLDPKMTTEFFSLIEDLNKRLNMAIIMVTHDTHCAAKYSKHILHLKEKSYFYGTTKSFLESKEGLEYVGGHKHD